MYQYIISLKTISPKRPEREPKNISSVSWYVLDTDDRSIDIIRSIMERFQNDVMKSLYDCILQKLRKSGSLYLSDSRGFFGHVYADNQLPVQRYDKRINYTYTLKDLYSGLVEDKHMNNSSGSSCTDLNIPEIKSYIASFYSTSETVRSVFIGIMDWISKNVPLKRDITRIKEQILLSECLEDRNICVLSGLRLLFEERRCTVMSKRMSAYL